MNKPDIKFNPNPRMRYEIILTIKDAPGSFDAINASANYEVMNSACVPLTRFSGATVRPLKSVPIEFSRVGEGTYKGDFYLDLMQDEDYYGLGLCRWSLMSAGFSFSRGNVLFGGALLLDKILAQNPVTTYFNNSFYFGEYAQSRKDEHPFVVTGNPDRTRFKEPANSFSMTLKTRENF